MLARLQADVIAHRPDMCIIHAGTNDVGTNTPIATTQANYQAIVAALISAGIEPVLTSLLPRGSAATPDDTFNLGCRRLSAWLRQYAATMNLRFIDLYGAVVNQADGRIDTSCFDDTVHQNMKGALLLGQRVVDVLLGTVPAWPGIYAPQANADPLNLWVNALAQTDAGADGVADGWSTGGSATTGTRSIASDADVVGGKIQQLVVTAGASSYRNGQVISTGLTIGRRYALSGRIKTSGIVAGAGVWTLQAT